MAAVAGSSADAALRFLEDFDADAARPRSSGDGIEAICRHAGRFPRPLESPHRRPRGDLRHRRAGPASDRAVRAVRRRRGCAARLALRLGDGIRARAGARRGGRHRGQRPGAGDRRRGASRLPRRRQGPAIAVLAGGPDVPYPRRNRGLYDRLRQDGVVLSELPPGIRPFRWGFPARNRIMAALSAITVVVEAAEPSGSLITSEFAAQMGRTVAAVPGRATSRSAAGSNQLHQGRRARGHLGGGPAGRALRAGQPSGRAAGSAHGPGSTRWTRPSWTRSRRTWTWTASAPPRACRCGRRVPCSPGWRPPGGSGATRSAATAPRRQVSRGASPRLLRRA